MEGGPGTSDPGRILYRNISLATLVRLAWLGQVHACQAYLLSAPGWLESEGFEIAAKLPPGSTWPQVRTMLQNLLAARFKLAVHSESKTIPAYSLIVGKTASKLQASSANPSAGPKDSSAVGPTARPKPKLDSEGFPVPPQPGSWIITRNGHTRMQQLNIDLATLARLLTSRLGSPVVDATGIQGAFDIALSWTAESSAAADPAAAPDLFSALQQQLGLRLEPSKLPVEVIVVDHAERVPVEN